MNKWNLKAGSSCILLEIQQEQITCFSKVIYRCVPEPKPNPDQTVIQIPRYAPSVTKKSENVYEDKSAIQVGGWSNPSEKYARQIGSSPQVGVKKNK